MRNAAGRVFVMALALALAGLALLGVSGQLVFAAAPAISINPTNGPWGSSVTVTGANFAANQTGIVVTFDSTGVSTVVSSGISADNSGTWNTTFVVPFRPPGAYHVSATDATDVLFSIPGITFTLSTTGGLVGTYTTVNGSGFGSHEGGITVTFDGAAVVSGIPADGSGAWHATFAVPPSATGPHTVTAYGSTTPVSSVPTATFTVNPSIAVSRTTATSGSPLTVSGSGFSANESGIIVTFDGAIISSGILASAQGGWAASFTVPPSASGPHSITAYGSITSAASVPAVTLTISPSIAIGRSSGPPGSSLTATGSGFAPNEGGITVTYDGAVVSSGISANTQGAWSATFTVPPSASGPHSITAYGSLTQANNVSAASFSVSGGLTLGRPSGTPGSSVTVNGSGFAANEGGITVTYDGAAVASGISANAQGAWSATFTVPPSATGAHSISAYGSITQAGSVSAATFSIGGGLTLGHASGAPGSPLTVSGSGFSANESGITVTYDGAAVASNIAANAQGAWSATFTVPPSASGSHSITAYGSITQAGSAGAAIFSVSGGLTLGRASGAPGSPLTVNGFGFAANEGGITVTYDGAVVSSGISANGQGSWSNTFTVPPSTSGAHSLTAYGATTPMTSVPAVTFTINPGIAIGRSSGPPGISLAVTGSGFAANEGGITVTYDGAVVSSGISANGQGSWSNTFTVPPSAFGSHSITAYGSITQASSVGAATFSVGGGLTLGRASGAPGSPLTVNGFGFAASEGGITVTYDGAAVASNIAANAQGAWSATFTVPPSTSGAHSIAAYGATTPVTSVPAATFTVNPGIAAGRANGTPGSPLTVTGSGFAASEGGITVTYDGAVVASGISANAQGSWNGTFTVPPSTSGAHSIAAYGATTPVTSVPAATFTINPGIAAGRANGTPGSPLTVTGSGFAANEGGITVTYDGSVVASGISANAQGSWSATFTVPPSATGAHSIAAYGATTTAAGVPRATFTASPSVVISQATGAPGSALTVSGSGFAPNEGGIAVAFDGAPIVSRISANAQGAWNATFVVPQSVSGPHSVSASGSITQTSSLIAAGFTTTPAISTDAVSGYVGMKVAVVGSGFAASSDVQLSYDGVAMSGDQITTDAMGSFNSSILIPKSKAGDHTIRAQDAQTNEAKALFTIESTPPPVPALLSPKNSGRVGITGGVSPTLQWTAVTDPSGVTYHLQVDTTPDFSHPVLDKTDITSSGYTLTTDQALPLGQYYWRVQAIDDASNQSAWSQPYSLSAGLMPLWLLIAILVIGIGVVLAGVYVLITRRAPRREAGEPLAVPGYWREIGPEEPVKPRGLPWRRALPTPSKGTKALSSEEQARIKIIAEFAQSLPLVEPGYNTDWLVGIVEADLGQGVSAQSYEQWLQGQLVAPYQPEWISHPLYQGLRSLLEGQPILQKLDDYLDAANRCGSECLSLLQEIYRDVITQGSQDLLSRGGFGFISGVYSDAIGWHRGKSLREPSARDYSIKVTPGPSGGRDDVWLHGAEGTSFSGPLVKAQDERDAEQLRDLHLKLRKDFRNSEKSKQLVGMIAHLQVQRTRLLDALNQLGRFSGTA